MNETMRVKNMQNKKISIVLSVILLLSAVLSGCEQVTQVQQKPYIAVVAKATESRFWKSVASGVSTAATEYGVKVTFEGARNEEDYATQNDLIMKAVENRAQAIVFSAIDANKSLEAIQEARKAGIYVVIIDSGINTEDIDLEISTDNYAAGEMAADAVLANKAQELKIGIVNFDINSANGRQREEGFKNKVLQDKRAEIVDIINVESNISSGNKGTKRMIEEHPEINVIATFNEWTSLGVGYAVEEKEMLDDIQVVGFDSNVILADMLERGSVDALILQNPFSIGYLGIENAYKLIKNNKQSETVIFTDTTLITRENMFDENNQKILFPIENE